MVMGMAKPAATSCFDGEEDQLEALAKDIAESKPSLANQYVLCGTVSVHGAES